MDSNSIQRFSASSSSTSSPKSLSLPSQLNIWKYDVFVSFRGEDTRYNFVDHLFAALQRLGIVAFRDNLNLQKGESLWPELLQAIEGSQVFIVVFSKNYASTTWCLRELAEIVDIPTRRVLPIFYDVDPFEVRKQSGKYGRDFFNYENTFKQDTEQMEEVKKWRETLTQVANLSGWDINNKPQHEEIEKILQQIRRILGPKFSSLPHDLVGVEAPIAELQKRVFSGSGDDVRVVGVCGMGGIGKTTLARVFYETICHRFDVCCFIDDVTKTFQGHGVIGLQRQFLSRALKNENLQVWDVSEGKYMVRTVLRHKRALIFLDNVNKEKQLKELALHRECLGGGSKSS